MAFVAGQKVRASDLNAGIPLYARVASDVSVISSTTLTNVSGLVVPLEASAYYGWEAYIAYDSNATADIKLALTVPSGASGHWAMFGLATTAAGTIGDLVGFRGTIAAGAQSAGGSDTLSGTTVAKPSGYITTSTTAGNLQVQFAQNTSNANNTTIKAGSWIRVFRIG